MYAKQGRGNQFTSRADRDKWITKELKALNKAIKDKDEQIKRLREDQLSDGQKEEKLQAEIEVSKMTGKYTCVCFVRVIYCRQCAENTQGPHIVVALVFSVC